MMGPYAMCRAIILVLSMTLLGGCGSASLESTVADRSQELAAASRVTVRQLPGSGHVLVTSYAPGHRRFTISTENARILGKNNFGLRIVFGKPTPFVVRSAALRIAQPVAGIKVSSPSELRLITPLEWEIVRVCRPYSYVVVYGLLLPRNDEVILSTKHRRSHFHYIRTHTLPHSRNALVYTISSTVPSRLLVRTRRGMTIINENISPVIARLPCNG